MGCNMTLILSGAIPPVPLQPPQARRGTKQFNFPNSPSSGAHKFINMGSTGITGCLTLQVTEGKLEAVLPTRWRGS